MNILTKFNRLAHKYGTNDNSGGALLQKAIFTSAPGVGESLIPPKFEKIITNLIPRLAPEIAIIKAISWAAKFYQFRRLTSRPAAGGAMGEAGATRATRGTYDDATLTMKIVRRKGKVTNFQQDASREEYDSAAAEMQNHLEVQVHDLIAYNLWGNKEANEYEYSGLDSLISTNRTQGGRTGVVPASLKVFDDMIDENIDLAGTAHDKVFLMSSKMASVFSRLITSVRDNRPVGGVATPNITINGGWELQTYRGIPIVISGSMKPRVPMGTITPSTATTGGTIPADEYFFEVAPITPKGEQEASTEVSQVTTGTTSTITLSFAAFPDALSYKVYVSKVTHTEKLRRMVPAFVYAADGEITGNVTSIVLTTDPSVADSSVPTHMQNDTPFIADAGIVPETVALWDLDPFQGIGRMPFTNTGGSEFKGLITMKQLAETDDFMEFLIKSYTGLADAFEATSTWYRGLKTE
jgi:hypothetical protein